MFTQKDPHSKWKCKCTCLTRQQHKSIDVCFSSLSVFVRLHFGFNVLHKFPSHIQRCENAVFTAHKFNSFNFCGTFAPRFLLSKPIVPVIHSNALKNLFKFMERIWRIQFKLVTSGNTIVNIICEFKLKLLIFLVTLL